MTRARTGIAKGAYESYAKHDVLDALDYPTILDGTSTVLFFVAVALDGSVHGGLRAQGPYRDAGQAHAVAEWAGHPGERAVGVMIADRIPLGVAEAKAAWVRDGAPRRRDLSQTLAQVGVCTHELLDEPTRWAYYPWRRDAVRILGPAGYRMLRLDRNRNKITSAEQDRLAELWVGVIGLSVGHAVALALALESSFGTIRLADFDLLDLSNLNRVPATVFDFGLNKAVVAARRIAEIDPYLTVVVWREGDTVDTVGDFLDGLDVLVEECDSLALKVAVRLEARRRGVPVVMVTSDRGLIDVERFDLEPERALFHGLLENHDVGQLAGLSQREKVSHILRILGAEQLSTRMVASPVEVGGSHDRGGHARRRPDSLLLAAYGRHEPVEYCGDPESTLVASMAFGSGTDQELAGRFAAMLRRGTNRRGGSPQPLTADIRGQLDRAARAEGARLAVVTDRRAVESVADVFAAAERIRFLEPRLHAEMINELRWPGVDSVEPGIDVRSLELDAADVEVLRLLCRPDVMATLAERRLGGALGSASRTRIVSSSALAAMVADGEALALVVRLSHAAPASVRSRRRAESWPPVPARPEEQ